jgi:NAD(P)H dehydrogenase (quinone)
MAGKPKVLIIFYTRYGNTAKMAEAEAEGAREAGADVVIKRIADDVPKEVIAKNPDWLKIAEDLEKRHPPVAIEQLVKEMSEYDAIIFGSPTRFGNMSAQMKTLWDRTSSLWLENKLVGKVGGVFTGAGSVHGGQETTAVSMMFPMLHQGMIIVGVPYSVKELFVSGSPYGPSSIVGAKADQLKDIDLAVARAHGKRIAEIASKLIS